VADLEEVLADMDDKAAELAQAAREQVATKRELRAAFSQIASAFTGGGADGGGAAAAASSGAPGGAAGAAGAAAPAGAGGAAGALAGVARRVCVPANREARMCPRSLGSTRAGAWALGSTQVGAPVRCAVCWWVLALAACWHWAATGCQNYSAEGSLLACSLIRASKLLSVLLGGRRGGGPRSGGRRSGGREFRGQPGRGRPGQQAAAPGAGGAAGGRQCRRARPRGACTPRLQAGTVVVRLRLLLVSCVPHRIGTRQPCRPASPRQPRVMVRVSDAR